MRGKELVEQNELLLTLLKQRRDFIEESDFCEEQIKRINSIYGKEPNKDSDKAIKEVDQYRAIILAINTHLHETNQELAKNNLI